MFALSLAYGNTTTWLFVSYTPRLHGLVDHLILTLLLYSVYTISDTTFFLFVVSLLLVLAHHLVFFRSRLELMEAGSRGAKGGMFALEDFLCVHLDRNFWQGFDCKFVDPNSKAGGGLFGSVPCE